MCYITNSYLIFTRRFLKMAIVTTTEMFKKAYDGGYAIGAFNVNNMEIVQGITEACKEEKAPVIGEENMSLLLRIKVSRLLLERATVSDGNRSKKVYTRL